MKAKATIAVLTLTVAGAWAFGLARRDTSVRMTTTSASPTVTTAADSPTAAAEVTTTTTDTSPDALRAKYAVPNAPRQDPPPNVVDLAAGKMPVSVSDAESRALCEANKIGSYGSKADTTTVRWAGKMTAQQDRDWVRGYTGGSLIPGAGRAGDWQATLCIYTGRFTSAAPPTPKPMGAVIEIGVYIQPDGSMHTVYMAMEQSAWPHSPTPEEVSAVGLPDVPPAKPLDTPQPA